MLDIIRRVAAKGLTIIVVEHVMKAVMNIANRILVLDHGGLIAQGSPEQVASDEEVIKVYLGEKYEF
ncbi:unnamed protein product [marine sediment metagenome]|uniref:Branched-chain amino acid ATP-binding cassette transporter C-terminal domain-containing protein n=1 Tax=marine sediment metagenome TaxID=412755 RepID=X1PFT8_9ZZZZ